MQTRAELWRIRLTYFSEFRLNWTNLLGAALGLALGSAINHYMMNIFGPALIAEFGWSKSQFALVGSIGLVSMLFAPIAGLMVDRFGSRNTAIIGFSVVPLAFFVLSLMSGNIYHFFAILLIKNIFGIFTTSMVFCRVVVERFETARGLALSFLLSAPPLIAAITVPIIGSIIEAEGWRTGYQMLALMSAAGGIAAIMLIGKNSPTREQLQSRKMDWGKLVELGINPIFLLLIAGMFLCNFPQIIVSSQMNLMLMESGASMVFATSLVSLYAISVVFGRFISGFALDRVAPHIVAILALGLPSLGYVALASTLDAGWVLAGSILLIGLAQGAETDVGAYLTAKKFGLDHYSFVFSMLMTSLGIASALGSILLSYTLHSGGNFNAFLLISAGVTLAGALCFYLTGRFDGAEHRFSGATA